MNKLLIALSILFTANILSAATVEDLSCTSINGLEFELSGVAGSNNSVIVSLGYAARNYSIKTTKATRNSTVITLTSVMSTMAGGISENYIIALGGDAQKESHVELSGYVTKTTVSNLTGFTLYSLPAPITCSFILAE